MLLAAVLLLVMTGLVHSYLGERYILIRLFRRDDLPKIFGDSKFTAGTLRFAWHLSTVAWWGLGYIVVVVAGSQPPDSGHVLRAIATVAIVSGVFPLVFTRGRHLSWVVFFAVGGLLLGAASAM